MGFIDAPLLGWYFSDSPPTGHCQGREEIPRLGIGKGQMGHPGPEALLGEQPHWGTRKLLALVAPTGNLEAGFFNPTANCDSVHWHLLSECRCHGAPGEAKGKGELVGVTLA